MDYLEYDNVALVTSHRQPIDKDGNFLQDIGATKRICNHDTIFSGDVIGKNILCNMLNFVGEPTTVLLKKEYLKNGDFGWTDLEGDYTAEDFPTYLHILEKGDLAYITDTLSYFRLHDGQCQRNIGINVRSTLCWIIDIQYAFHQKLYIKTIEDYRQAVFRVVDVAVNLLRKTADAGIANEDTELLWKKVIELLSELQQNEGNGIAYENWSQSYLDYDQIEIQNPELAGYKFTESVFEVNRNSKIVYCARFKLEKINKKFYEDFLIKLEEKYPLVKEEKPDLYQGDFGYEGELHNYSFGNYAISYIYYAPQETIEVVYFYIASQIGNEL